MIGPASLGVRAVQLREGCARGTGFSRPTFNNGVQHPQKVAASRFCVGFDSASCDRGSWARYDWREKLQ